jgi:Ca2+-binding EF-hand superfamily protein
MNYKIVLLLSLVMPFTACATSGDINNATDAFNYIDKNHSESIDFNEFDAIMRGEKNDIDEMKSTFKSADSNRNKLVSFKEVNELDEVTQEEFKHADKDNSGELDQEEFITGFIRAIFQEADLNRDASISLSEFKIFAEDDD